MSEIVKPEIPNLRSSDGAIEGDLDIGDWASCESPFEMDKDVRLVLLQKKFSR